jgi:hypothetical protein
MSSRRFIELIAETSTYLLPGACPILNLVLAFLSKLHVKNLHGSAAALGDASRLYVPSWLHIFRELGHCECESRGASQKNARNDFSIFNKFEIECMMIVAPAFSTRKGKRWAWVFRLALSIRARRRVLRHLRVDGGDADGPMGVLAMNV